MREVIQVIKTMAKIYEKEISEMEIKLFLEDLTGFTKDQLLKALQKYRQTSTFRKFPTSADIIKLTGGGHPDANEAWGLIPEGEELSYSWTKQMRDAYAKTYNCETRSEARATFLEVYNKEVEKACFNKEMPEWFIVLGTDKNDREREIKRCQELNLVAYNPKKYALEIDHEEKEIEYIKKLADLSNQVLKKSE